MYEMEFMFLVEGGPVGVLHAFIRVVCHLLLRCCKENDFFITNVLLSDNLTYS